VDAVLSAHINKFGNLKIIYKEGTGLALLIHTGEKRAGLKAERKNITNVYVLIIL